MKTYFVSELAPGQKLESEPFLISEYRVSRTKAGDNYYRFELSDKTGKIPAVMWPDNTTNAEKSALNVGEVISIDATVESFNDRPQLILQRIAKAKDYSDEDFKEVSKRSIEEMWKEVSNIIESIENEYIKKLLKKIFSDEEFIEKFKKFPAAKTVHHQFVGGLMEHILEMVHIGKTICDDYPEANRDLVYAGTLLHDIGKLQEYKPSGIGYEFSLEGKLIGHLVLGAEFVSSNMMNDFPKELRLKLLHIILSHHGRLEFGSPVVPKTIEAAIVRAADEASSKIRQYQKYLKNYEGTDQEFSDYDQFIESEVYLK